MNHREKFMRQAIKLAVENVRSGQGGPFGCVIVKNDQVVGAGTNRVTKNNDPTAHAEVQAIREACKKMKDFSLRGCELYASGEPCPMCIAACYWARVDKVYFAALPEQAAAVGFDDCVLREEFKLPLKARKLPIENLLPEESEGPFDAWRASQDKVEY